MRVLNMNGSNLELKRSCTVSGRHEGRSNLGVKHCYRNLYFLQRFLQVVVACFLVQHPGAWSVLVLISSWWWMLKVDWTQHKFVFHKPNCWTWSLTDVIILCKHRTSLTLCGCPCLSYALLKPCELQTLCFAIGQLDLGWVNCLG